MMGSSRETALTGSPDPAPPRICRCSGEDWMQGGA
jgi:hypothetical protein